MKKIISTEEFMFNHNIKILRIIVEILIINLISQKPYSKKTEKSIQKKKWK